LSADNPVFATHRANACGNLAECEHGERGMIQTTLLDVTKPCSVKYTPPSHEAGERWPGPEKRTRQLTLFDKQVVRATVVASTKSRQTSAPPRDESDDEGWFVVTVAKNS